MNQEWNNSKKHRAFTILEVMVVLGVIAAISALGVVGLVSFRNNLDIQAFYTDIKLAIKTTQNNARNSRNINVDTHSTEPQSAEYYVLDFNIVTTGRRRNLQTSYDFVQAYLLDTNRGSAITILPNEKESNLSNDLITFSFTENERSLSASDCENIGFTNTGNLVFLSQGRRGVAVQDFGVCTLTISHADLPTVSRQIIFDANTNKITYD